MGIPEIIELLIGVALFLFGMTLMGDGLKKVAGNKLELILYRLSNTPIKGVLLGTGVTAVIQSSCATSVMVVGFVNSGMMKLRQAISVTIGAILGTSITGWIISLSYLETGSGIGDILSTTTLTGIVAVVGIFLRMFSKKPLHHHIGDIMMGFSVLMIGMKYMSGSVSELGEQAWFRNMLTTMSNPLLGILVGTVFTAILQSASAAVGIVQALSVTGAMPFETALPLLMGIAIGASFPVLLSALGANTDGKRTALVYLVAALASTLVGAAIFYLANIILDFPFMTKTMDPFSIALVNTILRLFMVVLLMPFIDVLKAIVTTLVKDKPDPAQKLLVRLEERFIPHPALALEQSRLTINDMAVCVRDALEEACGLLHDYTAAGFEDVQRKENDADRYEDSLGTYLIKITGQELDTRQNDDLTKYLHTLTDFERISDHALNVAQNAAEMHDKKISFSDDAKHELGVITAATTEIVRLATQAFIDNDVSLAKQVEPLEEVIDQLCDKIKTRHVERLQTGRCTIQQGFILNDLLTWLERVGDHCSNVALAMLELEDDAFGTHEYLDTLKKAQSQDFINAVNDYKARFAI